MDLQQAITQLSAAGITFRARGDRLAVESKRPLIEPQREWIRTHKAQLLRALLRPGEGSAADPTPDPPYLSDHDQEALAEAFEERAAIQEHEGGLPRVDAEEAARSALRVYYYRVTDKPGTWLTLVCPGCDLEAARHSLTLRFGERLIDLVEHEPLRPIR